MNLTSKVGTVFLALVLLAPLSAAAKGGAWRGGNHNQQALLSVDEENTLLWMREEEKMARDVYLTMYKEWRKPVFANIADSEQNHMDAIERKIDAYGLEDPVLPGIGNFSNGTLQNLYDDLIARGSQSYIDALWVGATIEDLDIVDLQEAIAATDNLALQTTYANLLEGSKNHLRAFVGLLQQEGEDYQPQYIDQELFEAIIGF